jgi:hypothetical protein
VGMGWLWESVMSRWRILLVIVIGLAGIVALWLLGAVLMSSFSAIRFVKLLCQVL